MKTNFEQSKLVVNEIVDNILPSFKLKGDKQQIKSMIHPIIANEMYKREIELLEIERFDTLISLSRSLDNENLKKSIIALKYQLTIKEE